jgi:hypothetical protein
MRKLIAAALILPLALGGCSWLKTQFGLTGTDAQGQPVDPAVQSWKVACGIYSTATAVIPALVAANLIDAKGLQIAQDAEAGIDEICSKQPTDLAGAITTIMSAAAKVATVAAQAQAHAPATAAAR